MDSFLVASVGKEPPLMEDSGGGLHGRTGRPPAPHSPVGAPSRWRKSLGQNQAVEYTALPAVGLRFPRPPSQGGTMVPDHGRA